MPGPLAFDVATYSPCDEFVESLLTESVRALMMPKLSKQAPSTSADTLFSIRLVDIRQSSHSLDPAVRYCFFIESRMHDAAWLVCRRFSAFAHLHSSLQRKGLIDSQWRLPERHPWLFTDAVLASRAAYLQLFCQAILNDPHALGSSRVCAFFGLDEHIWQPVRSHEDTSSAPSSVGSSNSLASLDQLEDLECPP